MILFFVGQLIPSTFADQENFTFFLDKNRYNPRDNIHLQGWVDVPDSSDVRVEIINPKDALIFYQKAPLENVDEFDQIIPTFGTEWNTPGFYTIKITYQGETQTRLFGFGNFKSQEFKPEITLDKETYSWTDTVRIKIISPNDNKNIHQIDKIKIDIFGRGGMLTSYILEETGTNHGVFTGIVKLTGHSDFDLNQDRRKGDVPGYTQGGGPDDGYLSVYPNDQITFRFSSQFYEKEVKKTADIKFQLAIAQWENIPIYSGRTATARVIDPDMSVRPEIPDHVSVLIKSSVQPNSKQYTLEETSSNSGIFEGKIYFHSTSNEDGIFVLPGSSVSLKYRDITLPPEYLDKSRDVIASVIVAGETLEDKTETITIPKWVKKTAKWWSEGSIGDSGFAQSLNYLVEKKIVKNIPKLENFSNHSHILPDWLKKPTRWWSQNLITDDEFVKSIQYLLEHEIIKL